MSQRMELRAPPAHLSLLVALLLACSAATPEAFNRYTVGDAQAWNPGVNYTKWINKHKPFYVGDWLVFYYTSGMADVVQVADEAAYNKCDAKHPVMNYSKGRSFAFELNETKRYYFICSFGYCYQGMKLSIKAQPLPPPSPPPSKHSSASAPPSAAVALAFAAVIRLLFS